jgi:LCP family protein required for cell wall assembly
MSDDEAVHRTGGVARHGRLKKRGPAGLVVRGLAAALAVALVSSTSVAAIATWQVLGAAKPTVSLAVPGVTADPVPELTAQSGEVNMLLVATDTRQDQGAGFDDPANQAASVGVGNNDTTVLVHISEDHTNMAVISFPRDLMLPVPACTNDAGETTPASSKAMLNTVLARGGEQYGLACVASTISQLTGLQIDYAGSIAFGGVVSMADAVGGVEVCLATPIEDDDVTPALDLPAGTQTLTGAEAGAFLRSRHGVGDASDLGRISNQQTFMSALARQVVSAGTLTDPTKVLRLARTAFEAMTLSDTLSSPTTLAQIAIAVNTVGLSDMVFLQYPVADDPANRNRVVVDGSAADLLNATLQANQPIVLAEDSLGRSAIVDPNAPAPAPSPAQEEPAQDQDTATADPSATPTAPSPAASTPAVAASPLPSSVSGQSADQVTCAVKK